MSTEAKECEGKKMKSDLIGQSSACDSVLEG
jgi:hypothetical protein